MTCKVVVLVSAFVALFALALGADDETAPRKIDFPDLKSDSALSALDEYETGVRKLEEARKQEIQKLKESLIEKLSKAMQESATSGDFQETKKIAEFLEKKDTFLIEESTPTIDTNKKSSATSRKDEQQQKLEISELRRQVAKTKVSVFSHRVGSSKEPLLVVLKPDGTGIVAMDAVVNWKVSGNQLTLRWTGPNTNSVDSCSISKDGKSYSGISPEGTPVAGQLLFGTLLGGP